MTREEFLETLKKNNIPLNAVRFDELNGASDVFFIRKNYYRWEVSYCERGKEYECLGFSNESDALTDLLNRILPVYEKMQ